MNVAHGEHSQQRSDGLVARRLALTHRLDRQRIRQRPRGVDLQSIIEQKEPNPGVRHRVVAMHDRVHDRLEHCARAELRYLDAGGRLASRNPHVPAHEASRVPDLSVQRSRDGRRVKLVRATENDTLVVDGFDHGAGYMLVGAGRGKEHAGHGRPEEPGVVFAEEPKFRKLRFVRLRRSRADEAVGQGLGEGRKAGAGEHLLIRAKFTGTATALKESAQSLRGKFARCASLPRVVPARAPMHLRARFHLDDKHRPPVVRERQPLRQERQGRTNAVGADLRHVGFQRIHFSPRQGTHVAFVGDAEDHGTASRIAEGGKFNGQTIPMGSANPSPFKENLREFDAAVLAQRQLGNQRRRVPLHGKLRSGKSPAIVH